MVRRSVLECWLELQGKLVCVPKIFETPSKRAARSIFRETAKCNLTAETGSSSLKPVRLTIDISDKLALQVQPEREHLEEILQLGLQQRRAQVSGLRREFLAFLARGPQSNEIIAFQPSAASVQRVRDLLQRNKEGSLSPEEEAEMDDIAELDHLVTQIKAQARLYMRAA